METFIKTIELTLNGKISNTTRHHLNSLRNSPDPNTFVLICRMSEITIAESVENTETNFVICNKMRGSISDDDIFASISFEYFKNISSSNFDFYSSYKQRGSNSFDNSSALSFMQKYEFQKCFLSKNNSAKNNLKFSGTLFRLSSVKAHNFSVILNLIKQDCEARSQLNEPVIMNGIYQKLREYSECSNLKDRLFDFKCLKIKQELKDLLELTTLIEPYLSNNDQKLFFEKSIKRYKHLIILRGKINRSI